MAAGLRRWIPSINTDKKFAKFIAQFFKNLRKLSPSDIRNRFPKIQTFFHRCHIQVFNRNQVISSNKPYSNLVQKIISAMLGFRMQACYFWALLVVIARVFNHLGTFTLFSCDTFF